MNKETVKELLDITHRTMRYTHSKDSLGNVARGEFFVMNVIGDFYRENRDSDVKGITVTHIANIMLSATANASKLLTNMEKKGYVRRIYDEEDRRVIYIRLTGQGEQIIKKAREKTEERLLKIFEKMGEADTAEYLRLSRKLFEILQSEQNEQKEQSI